MGLATQKGASAAEVAKQVLVGEALGDVRVGGDKDAADWCCERSVGRTSQDVVDESGEAEDGA